MQKTEGFEELEWKLGKDLKGNPCLQIGGRVIHSLHDAKEQAALSAERILKQLDQSNQNFLFLIGLGLGYLPQALEERGFDQMLVWDPFPLMRKNLPVFGGQWKESMLLAFSFKQAQELFCQSCSPQTQPKLLIHPGYEPYCQFEYRQALDFFRSIFLASEEKIYNKTVVSTRSLESIIQTPFFSHLETLSGHYYGEKALLVSPGPSLNACLPYLKSIKEGIILAALQAVPLLQRHGIRPHFVVISDPQDLKGLTDACSLDFDAVLVESACHSNSLLWCPEKTWLFHLPSDHLHHLLWPHAWRNRLRAPIATVSETLLLLSSILGFQTAIFLGMDFCWTQQRYADRPQTAPKNANQEAHFLVPIAQGQMAFTEPMYYHASRFFNETCRQTRFRNFDFYQCSGGIPITAAEQIRASQLPDLLSSYTKEKDLPLATEVDVSQIAHAESLLLEAASSTHVAQRQGKLSEHLKKEWRFPFFDEIPPEKRKDICLTYQLKLREKTKQLLLKEHHSEG